MGFNELIFLEYHRISLFSINQTNIFVFFVEFFSDQLVELMHSRARRRFSRGLKRKPLALIKKLRKAKKEAPPLEKPAVVKTHLRNMIVVPEMVGSIIGIYNGKTFNQVSFFFAVTH